MKKCLLAIVFCFPYAAAWYLLRGQIGNPDYSLPSVVLGLFFGSFGLFGHALLIFEKASGHLEKNKPATKAIRYFFKSLGSLLLFPLALALMYAGLFSKPDAYAEKDLAFVQGTLARQPGFKKGAKSSVSFNIFLLEYPQLVFQPTGERYLHYQTDFEAASKAGDNLLLGILKDDYEKSIAGTKQKRFLEKHVNQHQINVYHISRAGVNYYNTAIHNWLDADDKQFSFIGVIMGLAMLAAGTAIWLSEITVLLSKYGYQRSAAFLGRLNRKK